MKIKLITILLLSVTITAIFASSDADIDYIMAKSEYGDKIKIEWKSTTESNLSHYVIERSPAAIDYFTERGSKRPEGNDKVYYFEDDASNKTNDMVFKYRVKAVGKDGQFYYSKTVSVSSGISDVKRTWGSIKAMFR
ncbi:MAG: hypothetical protein R6W90_04870 [Ignavibacteriaceae bacterium]